MIRSYGDMCSTLNAIRIAFVIIATVAIPQFLGAQVRVSASVDQTTIGTEESVRFTIEVEGVAFSEVVTPDPPIASGLTLLQRSPSTQQNLSFVNGVVQQTIGFSWRYRPGGEGSATIPAATVTVGGRSFRTEPIVITVVPQSQRPQRRAGQDPSWPFLGLDNDATPDNEPEITEQDVFIRATPNARTVLQNQELLIDYVLYFRHGVQLRSSRLADSWDASGFWREELDVEQRSTMGSEVVNGLRYNTVTLKRVAAFPTRTGWLTIEPLRIETEAALPRRNSFRTLLLQGAARFRPITVSSPPVTVESKPLPSPPEGFTGMVGAFQIDARVSSTAVEAGEPIDLTITVSGRGNIATLPEPSLQLPVRMATFGPEVSDSINRAGRAVNGSKTFRYTLVPESAGEHRIPGLEIPYYNPSARRYATLRTEPFVIQVTGTITPATASVARTRFPANDVAELLTETERWRVIGRAPLHRRLWPYLVILLPMALVGVLFLTRKRLDSIAANPHVIRGKLAHPVARKHLRKAEKLFQEGDRIALYEEVSRAVLGFVGDRLNIPVAGMTVSQIGEALRSYHVPDDLSDALKALVAECDRGRFSPEKRPSEAMRYILDTASKVIARLNDHLPRHATQA